jgi:ABC-type multidrug transport system ATPase subunit
MQNAIETFAPIAIRVESLWVVKRGGLFGTPKSILQDVSFEVKPGVFAAVVGPNGAGKTTMIKALTGERPAHGEIMFSFNPQAGFESFYDNPEYWLRRIGYVPVDNILHDELTVRQALIHVGRLRLPEVSDEEIERRMKDKLEDLGFDREDSRLERLVKSLSSGERKRANIAAELLTEPSMLLLDEPTSNLDPNAERDLMDSLRRIAGASNGGKGPTIVLITHTLASLDRCDQVVFITNSRLTQNGTPEEVFNNLEAEVARDHGQAALSTSSNQFEHWAVIFDVFKTDERIAKRDTPAPVSPPRQPAPRRAVPEDHFWRQFRILSNRYFILRFNDLGGIGVMLFSGFIAGFLLLITPPEIFLQSQDASAARQTVVLYIILAVIIGAFNSHREISKEFRIYIHERAKGLSALAYVLSKVVWLSVVLGILSTLIILALTGMPIARWLSLIAGIALFAIGAYTTFRPLGNNPPLVSTERIRRLVSLFVVVLPLIAAFFVQLQNKELPNFPVDVVTVEIALIITLILTSIGALLLGILVSSLVGANNDRATQFAIATIIVNVVLAFSVLVVASPQFQGLFDALEPFAVSYWGYSGFSSGLSIYCWAGAPRFENFNSSGHIVSTWLMLITHIVAALGLAIVALRLQETWTTRGRLLSSLFLREGRTYAFILVVAVLLSWSSFLNQQSQSYFELTFFDRLFGANRYAKIENVEGASGLQSWIGTLSQSPCGVRPESDKDGRTHQYQPFVLMLSDSDAG